MVIECVELKPEVNEKLNKFFLKKYGYTEFNPGNVVMPRKLNELTDSISKMRVMKDDVWTVSLPRTGSTWAQEMIWLLGNNLDYEGAKKIQLMRSPLLEMSAIAQNAQCVSDFLTNKCKNSVSYVQNLESPRFIKTHLPLQLLPEQLDIVKPKIIYISRNPKDFCVSYYNFLLKFHGMAATFEEFCELFMSNHLPGGNVADHNLAFWLKRDEPNILFLKYEDMKQDLPSVIQKCAKFLNFNRELTDEEMMKLCDYLNFDKMQTNRAVNLDPIIDVIISGAPWYWKYGKKTVKFIRKGQIGDWKNYMDDQMSRKFDNWTEEKMKPFDLEYVYQDSRLDVANRHMLSSFYEYGSTTLSSVGWLFKKIIEFLHIQTK